MSKPSIKASNCLNEIEKEIIYIIALKLGQGNVVRGYKLLIERIIDTIAYTILELKDN